MDKFKKFSFLRSRELIEWTLMIAVIGIIYISGYHTEVIGKAQGLILKTGIIQPDLQYTDSETDADFSLQFVDRQGNVHSLNELRGKTIFINFWATWCPPCVAEMPDIHNLYNEVGQDVAFVMISLDKNHDKMWDYIDSKEYQFPVYQMYGSMPAMYATGAIPTTVVVSKNGKIMFSKAGMAKYNTSKFKEFLRKM